MAHQRAVFNFHHGGPLAHLLLINEGPPCVLGVMVQNDLHVLPRIGH